METSLDFSRRYRVDGYGGVAFHLTGYATTEEYEGDYLACDDEECDHALSEMCWAPGEWSTVTDLENVVAIMVGDDRKHIVSVDDLEPINDDEYCSECGQIGCPWGANNA